MQCVIVRWEAFWVTRQTVCTEHYGYELLHVLVRSFGMSECLHPALHPSYFAAFVAAGLK